MNTRKLVSLAVVCGCVMLGGMVARANDESTAALIAKLSGSSDKAVLQQTIDELGDRGAEAAEAVDALVKLLKDDSPVIRAHAVDALGEIGEAAKPAVPALVELLKDPDRAVRGEVVEAVMHIHPGPQVTIPLCAKLLEDPDPGVRIRVLNAIADAGPEAVPGLIRALKNEKVAYWACIVLREIGPKAKDAVPALTEALADSHPEVRREAILALATMEEAAASAVPAIAKALEDEHTCSAATYALARLGNIPADAEARIRANVKSEDKLLGVTSLWALAQVHPEDKALRAEATAQLIERLKDKDAFVGAAAARALASLPPAPEITAPLWEKAMEDADEATITRALDALVTLGPPAVPTLLKSLKNEKARIHVVYVLGEIGPGAAPAVGALAQLIADRDEEVAREAILALAKIGPAAKDAIPGLVAVLGQADSPHRVPAAYALGKIGPDAAVAEPALVELLKDTNGRVALAGAWAIIHIHPVPAEVAAQTLPALVAGLKDSMPLARSGAVEALAKLGPAAKPVLPLLEQLAKTDTDETVRVATLKAIQAIGK